MKTRNLLAELVRFKTTSDKPKQLKRCIEYVASFLEKNGLKVEVFEKNEKYSLIASSDLKKHYKLILNGHLDVVPAKEKAFIPEVKNGRMYGRGTADMKGVNAAMINALLQVVKKEPSLSTALMLTTDEEIGGFDGVKYLLEEENYTCDCAFIPDGVRNWQLVIEEKGILHVKVVAKGKTGHGSQPWLSDNAVDKLIRIYNRIRGKVGRSTKDDNWKTTVNLGKLRGGEAANKVPAQAYMLLDFRFPKSAGIGKVKQILKKAVAKEEKVYIETLVKGSPLSVSKDSKYVQVIKKICKEKVERQINHVKHHSGSDARFFAKKDIPVIMISPNHSKPHIETEWIDLEDLGRYEEVVKEFILKSQEL